jgi:Skp family chaperone for outer membrane proteins
MNRTLVLTALALGLAASSLSAQTPAAPAATAPAAPAPVAATSVAAPPQAIPAKVAVIAFEQVVVGTNEGQRALADVQKKYEPKKTQIDTLAKEVDSLKQQLQALPATTPDAERAKRERDIDAKDKQLQLDGNEATEAYQGDLQEAYGKVAQKVGATAVKYTQDNGFTLLLNVGGQQQASPMLWWSPVTDISQAVLNAYNTASGVAAPAPSAPAPARRTPPPAAPSAAPKK